MSNNSSIDGHELGLYVGKNEIEFQEHIFSNSGEFIGGTMAKMGTVKKLNKNLIDFISDM